jgi:beta-phosphoglucomutase family hydrolase
MALACIFDCDGVIVDSASLHISAWKQLVGEEGLPFHEHLFKQSFGMKNEQIIPRLFKWTDDPAEIKRLDERKEFLYREIVRTRSAPTFPGVKTILSLLQEERIPCVIGSSAPRANVRAVLDSLKFAGFFQATISGDDVPLGKPDPQIFLRCAEALRREPAKCVVFEDALVGIAAARAAGMKVVAVTTTYPRERLAGADLVVDRLDELSIPQIRQLIES